MVDVWWEVGGVVEDKEKPFAPKKSSARRYAELQTASPTDNVLEDERVPGLLYTISSSQVVQC